MRMPSFLCQGAGLIVPEGIEAAGVARRADRVGQAEIDQRAELLARLRQEQRVVAPRPPGVAGIERGRDDVVVAGEHQRLFQLQPFIVKTEQAGPSS